MARRGDDVDDYVAKRIRERRREIGMSLEKLGHALGVSYQQVQKYENGSNRLSASRLYALAHHLDVTLDYFFEGVGSGNQPIPEPVGRNDRQVIDLVNSFTQISSSGARSAILRHVRAMAEEAQAKPRKKPRAKRKS